jgi:drug/metabolite transporter (DMT)-like permease
MCWGVADFVARFASQRIGAYRATIFAQVFGFSALSVYLMWSGGISSGVAPGWHPWALAALAGVINAAGSVALYHSFQTGTMSIVAPVSSSYPALTVILALLSGEHIGGVRGMGLAVTFIGIILAATSFAPAANHSSSGNRGALKAHFSKGVGWAIFAAASFGFQFWYLGYFVLPLVGAAVSVWVIRLSTIVSLALVAAPARQSIRLPRGTVWWMLAAVGLIDTSAFVANNMGLRTGQISLVTVLTSLYGAVTVLLAWIFLREKIERSQWLGIVLVFAGIILVSR